MKKVFKKLNSGFTWLVDFDYPSTKVEAQQAASSKLTTGFTIIETMITISIFLIVLMVGMDSLLNASSIYQRSRDQRSLMDNLSFIMEDMSRNIRTGYNFECFSGITNITVSGVPNDCSSSGGGFALAFESASGETLITNDQWVYKIEEDAGKIAISKSVNGGVDYVKLNPDEIELDISSGFYVTGSKSPSSGNKQQPLVTIVLIGKINFKGTVYPFSLQTTVSQRLIDTI